MYRCHDVTKNVAENVSIYVTLFCNDVMRYMYRDTMRYINMPNLLVLLYPDPYLDCDQGNSIMHLIVCYFIFCLKFIKQKQIKHIFYKLHLKFNGYINKSFK